MAHPHLLSPHLPIRRQAARDGVSQDKAKNVGEMAGEARFSPEMAATRGLHGDPAEARRDSPDPGRRHDGRLHLAATVPHRPAAAAARATDSVNFIDFHWPGVTCTASSLSHAPISPARGISRSRAAGFDSHPSLSRLGVAAP